MSRARRPPVRRPPAVVQMAPIRPLPTPTIVQDRVMHVVAEYSLGGARVLTVCGEEIWMAPAHHHDGAASARACRACHRPGSG